MMDEPYYELFLELAPGGQSLAIMDKLIANLTVVTRRFRICS